MNEINFRINEIKEIKMTMDVGVKELFPPIENLEVTPTKEQQVFTHKNSYGYDNVTVEPIPDEYIIPEGTLPITENTTYDVTNYAKVSASVHPSPNLQDKEVTPSKEAQNITSDEGYDGLNEVKVKPIPDSYIEPSGSLEITENGTYDVKEYEQVTANIESSGGGGSSTYAPRYISFYMYTGTELTEELANLDTSNLTTANNMFRNATSLTTIDLSNKDFSKVTNMQYFCQYASALTELDLSTLNLSKVSSYQEFCAYASRLTSVIFPSQLRGSINLKQAFMNCTALTTVDLSSAIECSDWYRTFYSCYALAHLDIRNMVSSSLSSISVQTFMNVPATCEIIVKDDDARNAILAVRSDFTNIKTVAEL